MARFDGLAHSSRSRVAPCMKWWQITGLVALGLLLVAIAKPIHAPFHPRAKLNACSANLKQIEEAKTAWAKESGITNVTAAPVGTSLFGSGGFIRDTPICPAEGTYRIGTLAEKPRCSVAGHTL